MKDFQGKKVTVMGIGLHGGAIETIKWLANQGARVTATDIGKREALAPSLEKLKALKNLKIITGQHRPEDFSSADLIVKNPAVPWNNKYIKIARDKKIGVETDSSLFFKYCKSKKIIGVTGTKGKTTTSLLIYHILKAAGEKVIKVGIDQEPVMSKLAEIDKDTFVVFELSSWRLSGLINADKKIVVAVITNIYPDHLNYYKSMRDYIEDKKIILNLQDKKGYSVLNRDNEHTSQFLSLVKGSLLFFSSEALDCDDCVFIKNGGIMYKKENEEMIIKLTDLKLRGHHNICNAMAAVGAVIPLGIKKVFIKKALSQFNGLAHRIEFVREIKGISFYNDTAATTPKAGLVAVAAFLKPTHLLCGGSSKNLDLSAFAKKIARSKYIKGIYLLAGSATENLKALITEEGGAEKVKGLYKNIDLAVGESFRDAKSGEVVLLSPACASFGMFKNEFDRGDKFKKAVRTLQS